jgi:stage V sporulation protein B
MKGTPISTFLCYLTVTLLNLYFVYKHVGVMPKLSGLFGKPLFASVLCAVTAYFSYSLLSMVSSSKLVVVVAIMAAFAVYFVAIFLVRGVSGDDIKLLPKGETLYKVFRKLKLVK